MPFVRTWEAFCDQDRCRAVSEDGVPLYLDDDHVNLHGARRVVDQIQARVDLTGR